MIINNYRIFSKNQIRIFRNIKQKNEKRINYYICEKKNEYFVKNYFYKYKNQNLIKKEIKIKINFINEI